MKSKRKNRKKFKIANLAKYPLTNKNTTEFFD